MTKKTIDDRLANITPEQARQILLERRKLDIKNNTLSFIKVHKPQVYHPMSNSYKFFTPYPYQREYYEALDSGKNVLVVKARQIGFTIATAVYCLRKCMIDNTRILVVSINQDRSRDFIRDVKEIAALSDNLPVGMKYKNIDSVTFKNGSTIVGTTTTSNTGRGTTNSVLVVDEFETFEKPEEMWASFRPTVSHGGQMILLSTPGLEGSMFHSLYSQYQMDDDWATFEIPWNECPLNDEKWYEAEYNAMSPDRFSQEYECKFGSGDDIVFCYPEIRKCIENYRYYYGDTDISMQQGKPLSGHKYTMGIDIAGQGKDKTVGIVLDTTHDPYAVVDLLVIPTGSAPQQEKLVDDFISKWDIVPLVDITAIGSGFVQHLSNDTIGIIFGNNIAPKRIKGTRNWSVARRDLIENLRHGVHSLNVCISPDGKYRDVCDSLFGAKMSKVASRNADHLDALALAYWAATKYRKKPLRTAQMPAGL